MPHTGAIMVDRSGMPAAKPLKYLMDRGLPGLGNPLQSPCFFSFQAICRSIP